MDATIEPNIRSGWGSAASDVRRDADGVANLDAAAGISNAAGGATGCDRRDVWRFWADAVPSIVAIGNWRDVVTKSAT